MGASTIYTCDWCEAEAPTRGSIGDGWEIVADRAGYKLHLCGTCTSERWKAISAARMLRLKAGQRQSVERKAGDRG